MTDHLPSEGGLGGRAPDLRLFLSAVALMFEVSSARTTYATVALVSAGLLCLCVCYLLGVFSARGGASRREAVAVIARNHDILLVGVLFLVSSIFLRASEVMLLAWLFLALGCFPCRTKREPRSLRVGLYLALALVAAAATVRAESSLLPAGWYAWPARLASRLWSNVMHQGGPGLHDGCIVLDGHEIHMSWLLNPLPLLPVLYCLLAYREGLLPKLAKAVGSVLACGVAILAIAYAASGFAYSAFPLSPASIALPMLQSGVACGVSFLLWRWDRGQPLHSPSHGASRGYALALVPPVGIVVALWAANSTERSPDRLRIAIDESHGRWETTRASFDTTEYGRDTVYNYRLLRDWLSRQHAVSDLDTSVPELDTDIVLIKTPTVYFSEHEKELLHRFVKGGGSLLVIGDHTNLFGSSAIVNDLVSWSGLRLEYDAVLPIDSKYHDLRPRWWAPLCGAPSLQEIQFQTSCSIVGNPLSHDPLIVAENVVSERADYSDERFFGGLNATLDDHRGPRCLAARASVGKGAVVLFGDSTIWSNFSFYAASNERLLASVVWDCGHRSHTPLLLGAVFAGLLLVLWRTGDWRKSPPLFTVASWLGMVSVTLILAKLAMLAGGPPVLAEPTGEAGRIVLDEAHSSITLRADTRAGDPSELHDYSTFYAWLSRAGVHPCSGKGNPYLNPDVPALVINPTEAFSVTETAEVDAYLRAGGRVLFLFDPGTHDPTAAIGFLERFGVEVRQGRVPSSLCDAAGPPVDASPFALPLALLAEGRSACGEPRIALGRPAHFLAGLHPLLADENGLVVAGEKEIGSGRLLVFARSAVLSEYFMGDVWGGKEPSPAKLEGYGFVYDLIRYVAQREAPDRLPVLE